MKRRDRTAVPCTLASVSAITLLLIAAPALGEGFRNPPPGTFNLGRAGGRIAHVDDASAVHHNPANLMELADLELQLTPTIVHISADFESPLGQTAETEDPLKVLPNLFLGTPVMNGNFAVGLGITTPYGICSKWDSGSSAFARPTGVLRYQAPYFAGLKTVNFSPGAAVNLGKRVRFGAALDILWADLTLKQYYPWMVFPGSIGIEDDGKIKAQGDGFGFGANVGLTWMITDRQRLAITYRSPVTVDLNGDFKVSNITPTAASLGVTPRSSFESELQFPTIVALGYGIQLTDKIRLEADVEWLEFSRFQSLDLEAENNNVLLPDRSIKQDWKDTFTFGIGGDWQFSENWVLRAGYQFYQSPVPNSTFSPTIPDADQNVITIGLGYKYKGHSFEVAYGADFYDKREIRNNENPAYNGDYEITVHLFSAAYRYRF